MGDVVTTQYRVNDATIEVPGFVTTMLQRFDIPGPGERVWNQPHPCVTLALSPPFRVLESQVTIGGAEPVYPVGDLFFQPAGVPLHYRGTGGKSQIVGCVYNSTRFEQMTGIKPDGSGVDLAAAFDIADTAIHQSMRFLARELDNPGFASIILVEALATAILVHLARYLQLPRPESAPAGGLSSWQLRRIRNRVDDPDQPPPPVDELAQLCNLSASHLSRAFKQSTGQTLYDYIRAAGIRKAEHFLLDTTMPLKSISHLLGFASQATFSMAFRNATGQTPSDYRQQFRRARQNGAK